MHRIIPSFLMIAAAVLASSCERGATPSTASGGSASALVGDEETATTMLANDAVMKSRRVRDTSGTFAMNGPKFVGPPMGGALLNSNDPTPIIDDADESIDDDSEPDKTKPTDAEVVPDPVEAEWIDGAELVEQSELSFTVTNVTSDDEIAFTVSVVSRSVIGEGERAIANLVLGPGESEPFSIRAEDLPIRSDKVVSEMAVGIRHLDPYSDYVGEMHLEASRFYRHSVGLETVRAFNMEMLTSELDGVLYQSDLPATETAESALEEEVVGYKDDESGTASPINLANTGLVSYDGEGNFLGITTSVGLAEGDASGEGAIVAPEDDPDSDEMEVADE